MAALHTPRKLKDILGNEYTETIKLSDHEGEFVCSFTGGTALVYVGEHANGKFEGKGTLTLVLRERQRRHGQPPRDWPSFILEGEWLESRSHGLCVQTTFSDVGVRIRCLLEHQRGILKAKISEGLMFMMIKSSNLVVWSCSLLPLMLNWYVANRFIFSISCADRVAIDLWLSIFHGLLWWGRIKCCGIVVYPILLTVGWIMPKLHHTCSTKFNRIFLRHD